MWLVVIFLLLVSVLAGCTTMGSQWNSRIGNYTFEQATRDLGPPHDQERLGNGTLTADWLIQVTRTTMDVDYGAGFNGVYGPIPRYTPSQSPDYYLRLVFGADGKLQSWKEVAK